MSIVRDDSSRRVIEGRVTRRASCVVRRHVMCVLSEFLGESLEPRLWCVGSMRPRGSHVIASRVEREVEM